eukprot:267257-Alexandrium_andersonii.AAC.1
MPPSSENVLQWSYPARQSNRLRLCQKGTSAAWLLPTAQHGHSHLMRSQRGGARERRPRCGLLLGKDA